MSKKSYCHESPDKTNLLRAARIKQIQINVEVKFILAKTTLHNTLHHTLHKYCNQ